MYPLSAIALRLVFFNHVTVAVCHATRRLLDMKSLAIMPGQLSYIKPVHTLAASNTRVLEQSKMRLLSLAVADGEGERKRERERERDRDRDRDRKGDSGKEQDCVRESTSQKHEMYASLPVSTQPLNGSSIQ